MVAQQLEILYVDKAYLQQMSEAAYQRFVKYDSWLWRLHEKN